MENHTAKHFVLQLGSLVSLYLTISFLLVLLFNVINLILPDSAEGVWAIESAGSSVRLGIAMVIVFFPTYLVLTRLVNKTRRKDSAGNYFGLMKWLIYLSLLIGGGVLLGDLVAIIMSYLNGEITQRFILKAGALLIIVGLAFIYYLLDAKGYWLKNEKKSIQFGMGAIVVVLMALIFGFSNTESPAAVREQKLDNVQITDLQNIQWQIQDYLVLNNTLPETLDMLTNESGVQVPIAPESRPSYIYELTDKGFKLCATFAKETLTNDLSYRESFAKPVIETNIITNPNSWNHGVGEVCFERIVSKNI